MSNEPSPVHFDVAIALVLRHEGGFVDDPSDPGGATKFGISLRYLRKIGDLDGDGFDDGDQSMFRLSRAGPLALPATQTTAIISEVGRGSGLGPIALEWTAVQ